MVDDHGWFMGIGGCADMGAMTSTTHQGDVFIPARRRRALSHPRVTLAQGLALLVALGVLVLLLEGHGVSWLAGLVVGASTTTWLVGARPTTWLVGARPTSGAPAPAPIDHGDADIREQLTLLEAAGWTAIHDLEARYGRYRHVAIGRGGVILLQSQRLEHPWRRDDPDSQRELLIQRRRALSAAANLRREIEEATGRPGWVQPVVVVWSEFSVGCVQDGRCVFVYGPRLIDWLRRRPGQLSPDRAAELRVALQRVAVAADSATSAAA
jgi:hypothetical protein